MSSVPLLFSLAILGGVAAGLQGPLSSLMGKHVGVMGSVFLIHLGGTLASALFLFSGRWSQLDQWRSVPWYALASGGLGLMLVGALTFCIPQLGVAKTITLVIVGQLLVCSVLDHYGLIVEQARHLDLSRVTGLGLLLIGTWFVVR